MQKKKNRQRGFSVFELLTVIAIIGTLITMAALSTNYIRRERLTSATRTLLADLQAARTRSLTTAPSETMPNQRGFGINFVSSASYSTFTFNDVIGVLYQYDDPAEAVNLQATDLPSSIELSIGGAAPVNRVLIFDRFGTPRDENWGLGNMTILLRYPDLASFTKCIVVSETRIREGNWHGAACDQQ